MQRIGTQSERKKNPYDPVAHPSLFFRNERQKGVSIDRLAQKLEEHKESNTKKEAQQVYQKGQAELALKIKHHMEVRTTPEVRKQKAAGIAESGDQQKPKKKEFGVPRVKEEGMDGIYAVASEVIQIMDRRNKRGFLVVKKDDAESLVHEALEKNPHLDKEYCSQILFELINTTLA